MIKGILLDLAGTIHVGDAPLPGAISAVRALAASGLPLRFVTNTSRRTRAALHEDLRRIGFDIAAEEIFTAPLAVRRYLEEHRLRPYLLVHQHLLPEYDGLCCDNPDAVVVGDAEEGFSFRNMNTAFRLLKGGARLLAAGRTRYFEGGGGLELDVGPFVAALEYAAETTAVVLGKPSPDFFLEAAAEVGVEPSDCIMVGDDAETDIAAALAAGVQGALVQTGKYREGDERRIGGDFILARNIASAVEEIVGRVKRGG
ncbi:TIGR01458 family HAD-type hydrolase [Geomonas sp. RF6]|uniref:TIGR01458 family HAD-type hydrolase n=1 Tax=Geomonas sp. RF6 TaxID=2897342 RepID=UPI001E4C2B3E|nr:TIGR01458 family HAD-type hydrolase [Geomonas sp. RF6]UFS72102.1 TIGR01458 family HAD-type hydrolase [Geomonas sp. RF6]